MRNNFYTLLYPLTMVLMIIFAFIIMPLPVSTYPTEAFARTSTITSTTASSCKCIIFRMDDIQDDWLNIAQVAVMNLFLSKNQSLSLGSIMHIIGNDSKIVDKVKEGFHKGLFELDLHGWDHINYTKLNENQQRDSLSKANAKMERLFGAKSIVSIPPYDVFNNDTIKAMGELGIKIISSGPAEEDSFDQNRTIFVANGSRAPTTTTITHDNNKGPINISTTIYHLPATIFFKSFDNNEWVKTPLKDIIGNVTRNIARYGYGVIVLHPQDFANSVNATTFSNSIDQKEVSDLSKLIDFFLSNNIRIMSFDKVTKYGTAVS
jgi:peptidoglycan/xylan/chitin deacetylase (PgdA/CDA1 family)